MIGRPATVTCTIAALIPWCAIAPRISAPMGVRTGAADAGCATVAVTITATLTNNAAANRTRTRATLFCATKTPG